MSNIQVKASIPVFFNLKLIKCLLGFSLFWVILTSFFYLDTLFKYPHSYDEYLNLRLPSDYWAWEDDLVRRDEALEYAIKNGHEAEARLYLALGLRFLKPRFSLLGFLKFVILPILLTWLLACFTLFRRKYFAFHILLFILLLLKYKLLSFVLIYLFLCGVLVGFSFLIKKCAYLFPNEIEKS